MSQEPPRPTKSSPLHILLVEDSPSDAKLVIQSLQSLGRPIEHVRVETAEAMRRTLASRTWDAIICDWSMPRFSAYGALKVFNESGLDLPFIIASGTMGEDTAVEAMRAGAHDYVLKDRLGRLPSAVERATRECAERQARRLAEQALRASEQRLATTLNSIGDAVIATDMEGCVAHMNPVAETLTGWPSEEANGKPLSAVFQIINEETRKTVDNPVARVLDEGVVVALVGHTILGTRNDGERPISATGAPIRDEAGRTSGVVLVFRDLTEQRRTESIRVQGRQSQEASRIKSEFLANMSHELRTPLNAIIGFAGLMRMEKVGPVSPEHREYLGDILTSSHHLLQLINDVLDLSKVEAGKLELRPEPANLTRLVGEVRDILRGLAAEKRLYIKVEIAPEIEQVVVDARRVKQVLYNYLSNAIKFTPEDGKITVHATSDGPTSFRLSVQDSGIGISAEDLGRLFVEFQQLDTDPEKKAHGTGLGLALTKRLVEALGGRVEVASVPQLGSTFAAILPRSPAANAA